MMTGAKIVCCQNNVAVLTPVYVLTNQIIIHNV